MAKRRSYDWERIEDLYVANVLSIKQIAREHGISDTAIRKRAKDRNWVRDLSKRIADRARGKVASVNKYNEEELENIIEEAANEITNVALSHRKDLSDLRDLEKSLIDRINGDNKKPDDDRELNIKDMAITISRLTDARNKRIEAERRAYNMDLKREDEEIDLTDAELEAEIRGLE